MSGASVGSPIVNRMTAGHAHVVVDLGMEASVHVRRVGRVADVHVGRVEQARKPRCFARVVVDLGVEASVHVRRVAHRTDLGPETAGLARVVVDLGVEASAHVRRVGHRTDLGLKTVYLSVGRGQITLGPWTDRLPAC